MACRPNHVRCFICGTWFTKIIDDPKQPGGLKKLIACEKCGDFKCPHCGACMCFLTKGEKRVAIAMIHTYERYIHDTYGGEEYDFEKHKEVEAGLF